MNPFRRQQPDGHLHECTTRHARGTPPPAMPAQGPTLAPALLPILLRVLARWHWLRIARAFRGTPPPSRYFQQTGKLRPVITTLQQNVSAPDKTT